MFKSTAAKFLLCYIRSKYGVKILRPGCCQGWNCSLWAVIRAAFVQQQQHPALVPCFSQGLWAEEGLAAHRQDKTSCFTAPGTFQEQKKQWQLWGLALGDFQRNCRQSWDTVKSSAQCPSQKTTECVPVWGVCSPGDDLHGFISTKCNWLALRFLEE